VAAVPARLTGGVLAVSGLLLVAGVVGARTVGGMATNAREHGAERAAAGSVRAFEASIDGVRRSVASVELLAPRVAASPATPPVELADVVSHNAVAAVAVVPAEGRGTVVAGTLPDGVTLTRLAHDVQPAMEVARDTGEPRAGVSKTAIGVAVPVYDGAVTSTAGRRAAIKGWVVAVVDGRALAAGAGAPDDDVTVRVAGVPVSGTGTSDRTSARAVTTLAGQPVDVVVTSPVDGGARGVAVAMLLLGVIGAAGALLVWHRGDRAVRRADAANEALQRETRTIAEIGPLLQQSLDLAEVLPAVAIRLVDEFVLDGLAVELIGEHGDPLDVFSIGRPGTGEPQVVVGNDGLAGGVEAALPLLRAGRTIGRLRFTPHDDLVPTQVDALRGAADLIAVATYNVELYEREQATVRRLQEVDRLKDAFLGTISHELRTPITAIGGFARMLDERWDDLAQDMRRDFIRRIARNSASLGLLVDDLLDFARLERQALQTNPTPMPLDTVVAAFVAQVVPALGDHPVHTDLMPGVVALVDPRAIERVLANLLTNAAKFSPAGAPIEVALRAGEQSAVLTVSDHGPGIAEEDRLRVFTRFYRGDSDAARSTRGAGIGLSVVHELVTQMGGDIMVAGREPNGTTMLVRLPLAEPGPIQMSGPRTSAETHPALARSTP
jgi:signal transduction histidine kinase